MAVDPSLAVTRREAQGADIPPEFLGEFWRHFDKGARLEGTPDELTTTEWLTYLRQIISAVPPEAARCRRLGTSEDFPFNQSFSPAPRACQVRDQAIKALKANFPSAGVQGLVYDLFLRDRPQAEQAFRQTHTIRPPSTRPLSRYLSVQTVRLLDRIIAESDIFGSTDPQTGLPTFRWSVLFLRLSSSPITKDEIANWREVADNALEAGLGLLDDGPRDPDNPARLMASVAERAALGAIQERCGGREGGEFDRCVRDEFQPDNVRRLIPAAEAVWIRKLDLLRRLAYLLRRN